MDNVNHAHSANTKYSHRGHYVTLVMTERQVWESYHEKNPNILCHYKC